MKAFRYLTVAVAAGAVGAGLALLYAPASGRETRRRIHKGYERRRSTLLKKGARTLDDLSDYVNDQIEEGRRAVGDLTDGVAGQLEAGRKRFARLVQN